MIRSMMLAALLALAATPSQAERRVYSGPELEALVCAHLFGITSVSLANEGMLSPSLRDGMLTWSVLIMERYVSGSWEQKMKALKTVSGRRTLLGSIGEFQVRAKGCLQRFPV
jgi:hypothetical protein